MPKKIDKSQCGKIDIDKSQ